MTTTPQTDPRLAQVNDLIATAMIYLNSGDTTGRAAALLAQANAIMDQLDQEAGRA